MATPRDIRPDLLGRSRAQDLFETLQREGESAIDDLVSARETEEYFLEFKRSADDGRGPRLHAHDRNNLSKAISGFGNSEGGVLVWGIDCSNSTTEKRPVSDVTRFVARLRSSVSGCTTPVHPEVATIAIAAAGRSEGFAATHVPASTIGPHQTVPEHKYYMRAGSSFVPVPHSVLAGMFRKEPQPVIHINPVSGGAGLRPQSAGPTAISLEFGIALRNYGMSVARDVFLIVKASPPGDASRLSYQPTGGHDFEGSMVFRQYMWVVSRDGFKLPPEGMVQPVSLHFTFLPPFDKDVSIDLTFGCAGGPVGSYECSNSPENVNSLYRGVTGGELKLPPHELADKLLNWTTEVG